MQIRSFQAIFLNFPLFRTVNYLFDLLLIEHETSNLFFCSLQDFSIFLYSNNNFFNYDAIYKN